MTTKPPLIGWQLPEPPAEPNEEWEPIPVAEWPDSSGVTWDLPMRRKRVFQQEAKVESANLPIQT